MSDRADLAYSKLRYQITDDMTPEQRQAELDQYDKTWAEFEALPQEEKREASLKSHWKWVRQCGAACYPGHLALVKSDEELLAELPPVTT